MKASGKIYKTDNGWCWKVTYKEYQFDSEMSFHDYQDCNDNMHAFLKELALLIKQSKQNHLPIFCSEEMI